MAKIKFNFKAAMLSVIFNLANSLFLKKVKGTGWYDYMKNRLDDFKSAAEVLIDENPDDKEQLNQVWATRGGQFVDDNLAQAERIIEEKVISKISDPDLAEYARNRYDDIEAIAKIVTDSDPNDAQQMKDLWQQEGEIFVEESVARLKDLISKQFPGEISLTANIMLEGVLQVVKEKI